MKIIIDDVRKDEKNLNDFLKWKNQEGHKSDCPICDFPMLHDHAVSKIKSGMGTEIYLHKSCVKHWNI